MKEFERNGFPSQRRGDCAAGAAGVVIPDEFIHSFIDRRYSLSPITGYGAEVTFMRIVTCTVLLLATVSGYGKIQDVRELNSEQIQSLDRDHTAVVLQGGTLEEHGPYLPSYSDGYQTEFVAARLS